MALPELDFKCWRCWGEGVISLGDHGDMVECPECGGIGWIPTEDGKQLLEFLHRHLAIEVGEDESEE
ncbi:hypothetical protein [Desulforhabdus amnigena]|jgi:ribosomal protein S27AE|uniref:Uncharacterized protein n=1 Tax=Desulforhabdus amnigena TaxID=40218 RepID=A0A9W6FVV9_9BACT|nr:hypothetical protein [Desulforhabdus amnigena]NLJ27043.1 hypothetical protein [Deltaproteobacteria bacterium]GLI35777.1 hypothetical protein DAMNIGENAA_32100 [Desulforhabdus amnigena]